MPSPRSDADRATQIRAVITYAIDTKDIEEAVRALDIFVLTPGSALAKILGAA